jgi:succinate dehydrogenase / fumarate reductase, cytochrome b subunit
MLKALADNFLLRRLHSLSGIVPIGLFVCFHLFANSTAIFSADNYNVIIKFLRSIPFLHYVEWAALFGPIAFHAIYGVIIVSSAKPNHVKYNNSENWRYFLMRVTGMIALVYIVYHIFQFRLVEDLDYNYMAKSMVGVQEIPYLPAIPFLNPFSIYWFYIIGIVATVFHFANGVWSFCITWGITVSHKSQQMVAAFSLVIFAVLTFLGVATTNHLYQAGQAMIG